MFSSAASNSHKPTPRRLPLAQSSLPSSLRRRGAGPSQRPYSQKKRSASVGEPIRNPPHHEEHTYHEEAEQRHTRLSAASVWCSSAFCSDRPTWNHSPELAGLRRTRRRCGGPQRRPRTGPCTPRCRAPRATPTSQRSQQSALSPLPSYRVYPGYALHPSVQVEGGGGGA